MNQQQRTTTTTTTATATAKSWFYSSCSDSSSSTAAAAAAATAAKAAAAAAAAAVLVRVNCIALVSLPAAQHYSPPKRGEMGRRSTCGTPLTYLIEGPEHPSIDEPAALFYAVSQVRQHVQRGGRGNERKNERRKIEAARTCQQHHEYDGHTVGRDDNQLWLVR